MEYPEVRFASVPEIRFWEQQSQVGEDAYP